MIRTVDDHPVIAALPASRPRYRYSNARPLFTETLAEQAPAEQAPDAEEPNPAPYCTSMLLALGIFAATVAVSPPPAAAVVVAVANSRPLPQVTRILYAVAAVSPVAT